MEKLRQFFDELENGKLLQITKDALWNIKTDLLEDDPNESAIEDGIDFAISDIESLLEAIDKNKSPEDVEVLEKLLGIIEEWQEELQEN